MSCIVHGGLSPGASEPLRRKRRLSPDPALVLARLTDDYGFPRHGNPKDIFYCAVYVLLSAQTTLEQAAAARDRLRRQWPTVQRLDRARPDAVRRRINSCGFGETRTKKIRALAAAVAARPRSLRSLRHLSDTELEAALVELPGIGFKSARVIAAMSSLKRDRFAVDTHVWRIAQRLGWVPKRRTDRKPTERQANTLEDFIVPAHRRQLHACLVALGRDRCRSTRPRCMECPLSDVCRSSSGKSRSSPHA